MTKDKIFDYVVEMEDILLNKVRVDLKKEAYDKFGDDGVKVVEKYYRQIDGEEEFDDIQTEDCDDCKEKAKRLVEILEFLKICNDILTTKHLEDFVKEMDLGSVENVVSNYVNNLIVNVENNSCFDLTPESKKQLYVRVLLELCWRKTKNDNCL